MHIGYHAADIALRIRTAIAFIFFLAGIDISLYPFFILKKITMIYGIYFPAIRTFDIRMTQGELADGRVQRKPIHPPARSIDHHSGRSVNDITSCDLVTPGLKKIFPGAGFPSFTYPAVYTKDSTDGHIHIDIAAAIEGIEQAEIF